MMQHVVCPSSHVIPCETVTRVQSDSPESYYWGVMMSLWIHFIMDCSPFPGCTNDAFIQTHVVENRSERERERETNTQACSAALSVIKLHGHYRCFACVYAHFHTHTTTPGKPRKGQSWMERYNKRDSEREGSKRQDYEVWKNQEDVMQKEIYGRM